MSINVIDVAVLTVLAASVGLALMRGFVREVLSIACWIAATVVALLALPSLRPVLAPALGIVWLADIVGGVLVFLATLVVLSLLTHILVKTVRASPLSALDRGLGAIFGLGRGVLILTLLFLAYSWIVPPGDRASVVTEATSRPYLASAAGVLQSLLPPDWLKQGREALTDTISSDESGASRQGYSSKSAKQMRELLQQLE